MNPDKDISSAALTTTLANVLALDITERRRQALSRKINPYPRTVSILSDIAECDRQLVYAIGNWKDRKSYDEDLQARFDAGKEQEKLLVRDLIDLGYEVISGQEVVEIKNRAGEVIGRGKIDGKILYQKIKIPFEIKSMNPNVFDGINSLEDLLKKPYLRKYLRQLQAYLYGHNAEEGLLMLTNCLGAWKIFPVTLDYGEAEAILQRLERVHSAVKTGKLPDRIEFRDEICGKCPFAHICLPDVLRTEMEVLTDPDLLENLKSREQFAEARSAYEKADKAAKDFIKKYKVEKGVAGEYVITSKVIPTKERAAVPAGTMTRISITRLGESDEE